MTRKATSGSFTPGDPRAGRPKGVPNKATVVGREFARQLVEDPKYRERLQKRMDTGELAPVLEQMIWNYAYGKPPQSLMLEGAVGIHWKPVIGEANGD